jgi:nucleoside 2-deoxyribosyltransferase
MKIFIAYKFTGETRESLENTVGDLTRFLKEKGHDVYCTLLDKNIQAQTKNVLFDFALKEIDKSEVLMIFLQSKDKSEGMLMEVGYAMAKNKRIVLLVSKEVKKTHLMDLVKEKYKFNDMNDLYTKLEAFK